MTIFSLGKCLVFRSTDRLLSADAFPHDGERKALRYFHNCRGHDSGAPIVIHGMVAAAT